MRAGVLAIFGGRTYQWDLNLVYSSVLKNLKVLISDR